MEDRLTPTKLAAAGGISLPFASQILSGARRPSQHTALRIFRVIGAKFGPLDGMDDADVRHLDRLTGGGTVDRRVHDDSGIAPAEAASAGKCDAATPDRDAA